MQMHWRHPERISESERDAASRRLLELQRAHTDLTDLWIDVAAASAHHRRGDEKVTIRCQARRATIIAVGTGDEPDVALRAALEKFEREAWRLRDRRSEHRIRPDSAPPHLGIVDRIVSDEGYGFLLTDSGEQVYFHRNALHGGLRFEALEEGQRIALNYQGGDEGLQASVVTPPPLDAVGSP